MAFPYPIVPGASLVCQSGWAHHGPVQAALAKDILHSGSIYHRVREEQPAEKVGWRHDGILEQKGSRLDYYAPDSGMQHGACQRNSKVAQKVRVVFGYRHPWAKTG